MKYDCAVFDLDGTLLNTLKDLYLSVNRTLKKYSLPERSEDEIRLFVGNGVEMLVKRSLGEEHEELLNEALEVFKKDYSLHGEDNTLPYEGIGEMLVNLKERGIKLAVVSNKFDGATKKLTAKYFGGLIDIAIGESENVRKKPAPDSLIKAVKTLKGKNAVYIGDSDVDIQTAKNGNVDCISVTWGFRDKDFLIKNGGKIFVSDAKELENRILNG